MELIINNKKNIYFLNLCNCGAESFTFPGIFLAITSSLTPFNKSFSLDEHALSRIKISIAVLDALPRRPVPGVIFTLNLNLKKNLIKMYFTFS